MSFVTHFKCQWNENSFKEISSLIDTYPENDERAMVYVQIFLEKAKAAKDIKKIIAGYEDAIYYSRSTANKLIYADSTIAAAKKSADHAEISRAYLGKGIVYYYNVRSYRKALEEYLKAFSYAKDVNDNYLRNKIVYHLGMVKYYLGSYAQASKHFTETSAFFRNASAKKNIHRNTRLNYESGYYNSIYRLSECYRNMRQYDKEDSLVDVGLGNISSMDDHSVEFAYFQQAKGIRLMRQKKYQKVIGHFKIAESILEHKQDFAGLNTLNFYIGKYYWDTGNRISAIKYFKKIDSVFSKSQYITPEIRLSFEHLIDHAKQSRNKDATLHYTTQLLKADSIIITDQPNLSTKITSHYDTERLTSEKEMLLRDKKNNYKLFFVILFLILAAASFIIYRYKCSEKKLTQQYQQLVKTIEDRNKTGTEPYFINRSESGITNDSVAEPAGKFASGSSEIKKIPNPELINKILQKLQEFEEKKGYLEVNMKLPDLAVLLNTNRSTLSYILNDYLHTPYPDYIKRLRINHITALMMEDRKNLLLNVEALAHKCGISSRQVFTLHFKEINGMSPIDFMRKRLEELDRNQT
ncbi:helix-turn-helix domain-containing protein [Chryseobacterium sp. Leaf180]|uniref:helix-turn-helix domain-containing protein n=1 Tax=Chryseobacterium sp. Leaf180 TaxID=1736289 RepID=UPI0006FDBBE1|nr:helix-turn-helix domain-containing protein [Chryseobacterium sp. Leaf180]